MKGYKIRVIYCLIDLLAELLGEIDPNKVNDKRGSIRQSLAELQRQILSYTYELVEDYKELSLLDIKLAHREPPISISEAREEIKRDIYINYIIKEDKKLLKQGIEKKLIVNCSQKRFDIMPLTLKMNKNERAVFIQIENQK